MRRRNRIATIVMLLGLLGSGAILGVGRIKYTWAAGRLAALEAQCPSVNPNGLKPGETLGHVPPDAALDTIPPPPLGFKIDKPSDFVPHVPLRDICDSTTSIGLEIAEQSDAREKAWNTTWDRAWFLALLLSLPRAWYFLLDRIGELAESIRGDRGSA